MKDKQVAVKPDDWLRQMPDNQFSVILAMQVTWQLFGKDKIDNLREYIKEIDEDLSDEDVEAIAKALIEHGLVAPNN